jgi:hypothetical protein
VVPSFEPPSTGSRVQGGSNTRVPALLIKCSGTQASPIAGRLVQGDQRRGGGVSFAAPISLHQKFCNTRFPFNARRSHASPITRPGSQRTDFASSTIRTSSAAIAGRASSVFISATTATPTTRTYSTAGDCLHATTRWARSQAFYSITSAMRIVSRSSNHLGRYSFRYSLALCSAARWAPTARRRVAPWADFLAALVAAGMQSDSKITHVSKRLKSKRRTERS